MATTYYASHTEPLNWDAHTNISWALLFIAIIVIPGLLTFVESFVEPDGSGPVSYTHLTLPTTPYV